MKKDKQMPDWVMPEGFLNFSSACGFVYKITRLDGKFYIGKKLLYFKKRKKAKGKRDKIYYEESDWKTYFGSSNELKADIDTLGYKSFKREILSLHFNKYDLTLTELKQQLAHDVMNPNVNTYNGIISVRLRKRSW
jgi:hypothetical protein